MIISASRRTDIPSFYSQWFMNRIQSGYCTVPNPFNGKQISRISLQPKDVDAIVFWTRNPRPLMPSLKKLTELGYNYYFQFTVLNYPREIDVKGPSLKTSIDNFKRLSDLLGPEKVIWRYDPVVFSSITGSSFHIESYRHIAESLKGYTQRSVISLVDNYRKTRTRLSDLEKLGVELVKYVGQESNRFNTLMNSIVDIAKQNDLHIFSCAEDIDLSEFGILPGKCIDNELIRAIFSTNVTSQKDKSQRDSCGCVASRDIGMYDTCLFECQYCYATSSFAKSKLNYASHNPESPSLLGWYDIEESSKSTQLTLPLE